MDLEQRMHSLGYSFRSTCWKLTNAYDPGRYGAHTCSWKIGGHDMEQCGSCPEGCSAADGPNECEAGCVFAFAEMR